jgi:signal transduction histidine kinase
MRLEAAAEALWRNLPLEAAECVERACEIARHGLCETRLTIAAVRSQGLEGRHLCEALHAMLLQMTHSTSLAAQFISCGVRRDLPKEWEENLFHIVQEALTNSIRHAQASEFKAHLVFRAREVRLDLSDNGCGFALDGVNEGFGLLGMQERTEILGGQFSIRSAKGAGTSISVLLHLADPQTGDF